MTHIIPVYSEQELSPRAVEVIRKIMDDNFGVGEIKFRQATAYDSRLLVFGKAPAWVGTKNEFIYTYSIAQIMTKANAASVLTAGVRLMIGGSDPIPFISPSFTHELHYGLGLDFDEPIVIDIETSGNLGKTHTPEEVGVISVAFYQPGNCPTVLIAPEQGDDLWATQIVNLKEFMGKIKYPIYHNGKFDTRVLNRVLNMKLPVWFDTMLAHHVLNHAAGDHKLKTLARRYLGAPEWETGLGQYTKGGGHYELIPQDKLVEYNGWDVYWTYKLYELFSPMIAADEDYQKAFNLEMRAAEFLLDVEVYGIPFDKEYAEEYSFELDTKMKLENHKIHKQLGYIINLNSPQQVMKVLQELGIKVPNTDANKTLKPYMEDHELSENQREFLTAYLEYKRLGKIRGTYAVGWGNHERGGRVHPTFLVHGTTTGRLSSTGPNAQNVPRDKAVRKLVKTNDI